MRDFIIDVLNHRFVFTLLLVILIAASVAVFRDGFQPMDIIALLMVALGYGAIWRLFLTHSAREVNNLETFQKALRNSQRPTLVQFYSPYCAGCMAVKPLVDQLEREAGNRLQIIRLIIDLEPGKSLMQTYGVIFTPTFVYFDKTGTKLRDSIFVVDRARILYELDRP